MTKQIFPSTVKNEMINFYDEISNIKGLFERIDENYVNGTKDQWSTPLAASYIDGLVVELNDYIEQFNTLVNNASNQFLESVNDFLSKQSISKIDLSDKVLRIKKLSKTWQGVTDGFNIPDNYSDFTTNNLVAHITSMSTCHENMKNCINNAVANGLSGAFCNQILKSIADLIDSATEVSESYSSKAAEDAVSNDSYIKSVMDNT